jgi:AcrR family transcriptional regulator
MVHPFRYDRAVTTAPTRSDSLRIRAVLLTEARQMLQSDGHPVALNALARRAGVGVGTVYRHFPTSQDLLEAVASEALEELHTQIREASGEADAWTGLERVIRAQVRMEVRHVGMREVLASAAARRDTEATKVDMAALVDDLITRARAAGILNTAITATDLRNILCGVGYTAGIDADRADEIAETYVEIILAGLRYDPHRTTTPDRTRSPSQRGRR